MAQLVEHGACNVRVVGTIPTGDQYENVCTHYCKFLWVRVSAKLAKLKENVRREAVLQ